MKTKNNTNGINDAGSNVQFADQLLTALSRGQDIEQAILNIGEVELQTAGAATSLATYSQLAIRLAKMDVDQITSFLNKPASPGEYYKNRAGVKHAIAAAFSTQDVARLKVLTVGYQQHVKVSKFNRRQSKRTDNKTIVEDWRDRFLTKLEASESKYKQHALLCYLTGMRPHEFTSDFGATVFFNGSTIEVEIKGAKVKTSGDSSNLLVGMPKRRIIFGLPTEEKALQMLQSMKPTGAFKLEIQFDGQISDKDAKSGLAGAIATFGKGLLGTFRSGKRKGKNKPFSAYNLRHMFASTLKATDMDEIDISRAMGHISQRTKGYYGRYNAPHSSGGCVPDRVTSSHEPRGIKGKTVIVKAPPPKMPPTSKGKTQSGRMRLR